MLISAQNVRGDPFPTAHSLRSHALIIRRLLVPRNWHVPCIVSPGNEQARIGAALFPTQTIVELKKIMKRLSHMLTLAGIAG